MDSKVNYTLVGFFVISMALMMAGYMLWMSKYGLVEKQLDHYLIKMDEAVSGLNIESPVKYRGVDVGTVDKIEISTTDPEVIVLYISVRQGTPITDKSVASLASQGITGLSYIEIKGGSKGAQRLNSGDTIPSGKSLLVKLEDSAFQITEQLSHTLSRTDRLLSDENIQALNTAINNLGHLSANLNQQVNLLLNEQNLQALETTLANSEKISSMLEQHGERLISTTLNLEQQAITTLQEYNKLAKTLNHTTASIQQRIDRAEYDIRSISEPLLEDFSALSKRLEALSSQTELLVRQLRSSPSDLLYKQAKTKRGPGER